MNRMDKKYLFDIKPLHWWQWLSIRWWKERRAFRRMLKEVKLIKKDIEEIASVGYYHRKEEKWNHE